MKLLKITAIALVIIAVGVTLAISWVSEPLPKGEEGPAAEALADKMLNALNKKAYDSIAELRWTFYRGHDFVWDKQENLVNARWEDYEVDLDPETQSGAAYKNGVELQGEDHEEALQKAWALFANDSFWLVAPFKVRDPGTQRQLIETEEGPALLVTYTSGGVTPGDSYLWLLDESGRPTAWEMWVSILPWKGMRFSWEDWQQYDGVWLASKHRGPGPISVDCTGIQAN